MSSESDNKCQRATPQNTGADPREQLVRAIEEYWTELLRGIRIYVFRFGLATDRVLADDLSMEVLQDTIVTALHRHQNYDPSRPARSWLLGVAINHLRHRRRSRIYEDTHRTLVADSPQVHRVSQQEGSGALSEAEMFDLLCAPTETTGPGEQVTMDELLSLVEGNDREVLRLAFVEGYRGKALAERLCISEGAAYTRQSRAIARLRRAYMQRQ